MSARERCGYEGGEGRITRHRQDGYVADSVQQVFCQEMLAVVERRSVRSEETNQCGKEDRRTADVTLVQRGGNENQTGAISFGEAGFE